MRSNREAMVILKVIFHGSNCVCWGYIQYESKFTVRGTHGNKHFSDNNGRMVLDPTLSKSVVQIQFFAPKGQHFRVLELSALCNTMAKISRSFVRTSLHFKSC